jgi:nucleotide sugar dehydrogenase
MDVIQRNGRARTAGDLGGVSVEPFPEIQLSMTIGIVGLGYVGLPTAIAFGCRGHRVVGVDVDERRLEAVRDGRVDLLARDHQRLSGLLSVEGLDLTADAGRLAECDAVIICVPTPVDAHLVPHLGSLEAACESVVAHARVHQTLILTSTTYAGSTVDLLVRPLTRRGFTVGEDIFVAFSPERIDPANELVDHAAVPRVVGGHTEACARRAAAVLSESTPEVHRLSSPAAAELCKLLENSFRAVNISLANEFAEVARCLDVDPIEVVAAAATKPYGFMPFYPGPGVGGHCIPCDPHYLRWQMRAHRIPTPVVDAAMDAIAHRPGTIVGRVVEIISARSPSRLPWRVLVVGVSYKPNVVDVRESPAVEILSLLRGRGLVADFHDPLVEELRLRDGTTLRSVPARSASEYDAVLLHTVHDALDIDSLGRAPVVIDATYRLTTLENRVIP